MDSKMLNMRQSSFPFSWLSLSKREDYGEWKFKIKMYLMHEKLWETICGYPDGDQTSKETRTRNDQLALAKICMTLNGPAITHVRKCKSASEAWQALAAAYEDKSMGRRLSLERRLYRLELKDFDNNIEAYIDAVLATAQDLSDIGKDIEDASLAAIILGGLTERYVPLIMTLENSNTPITTELVKGRLLSEVSKQNMELNNMNGALRTLEQSTSSTPATKSSQKRKNKKKIVCYNCKEPGHKSPDCPHKNKDNKGANAVTLSSALNIVQKEQRDIWYIDSGATNHMTSREDVLQNVKKLYTEASKVTVANGEKVDCTGVGEVKFSTKDGIVGTISNVSIVPKLNSNLISVKKAVDKGFTVVFDKEGCNFYTDFSCTGNIVLHGSIRGGLYTLDCSINTSEDLSANTVHSGSLKYRLWHKRLGHLCRYGMNNLKQGQAIGLEYDEVDKEPCVSCIEGKQSRKPFKTIACKKSTSLLEIIHSDICGPMSEVSFQGNRYVIFFIDDYSRRVFAYFMSTKTEVMSKFCEFQSYVETQTGSKIKILRTDNGSEYVNKQFENYLTSKGIEHQTSVPYSPQQNGIAERTNRSIIEKARSMLAGSSLSKAYWQDAVDTAVYLKNRSPHVALKTHTPFEKWTGNKPNISNLRVFGCRALVQIPSCHRKKLDLKAAQYIFVGYTNDPNSYMFRNVLYPRRLIKARDVTFFEECFTDIKSSLSENVETCLPLPIIVSTESHEESSPRQVEPDSVGVEPVEDSNPDDSFSDAVDDGFQDHSTQQFQSTSREQDDTGCRYPLRSRLRNLKTELIDTDEPICYADALNSDQRNNWIKAMNDEYQSLIKKGTWVLVDKPNKKVIPCKWVYKIKRNEQGNPIKYKARLVAKGFKQVAGVDYDETFSPVVRHSSLRMLLALAAEMNLDIHHLDVDTAFLNGDLEEEVYMFQPQGFNTEDEKVCLLKKSLYGLKQAPRAWNLKLNTTLSSLGFKQTPSEPCVYTKLFAKGFVILAVYVDDILIFHNSDEIFDSVRNDLNKFFSVKDLGKIKYFLGLNIQKCGNTVKLSQHSYIRDVLRQYNMSDCKSAQTPLTTNKLVPAEHCESIYPYQSLMGSLMYIAVNSRPDISFAVSYLSQFNTKFDKTHWLAAKRVLQYLKGTIDYSICYKKTGKYLTCFTDADFANDCLDRRSYTGFYTEFGGGPVSWESKKQPTVALSSAEAEYMALSSCAKEAVYLRRFLSEISNISKAKVTIYNDSQSAQMLAKNPIHHNRTKHIDIRFHFIREKVSDGTIQLKYLPTADMPADVLTKPLRHVAHDICVKGIGLTV